MGEHVVKPLFEKPRHRKAIERELKDDDVVIGEKLVLKREVKGAVTAAVRNDVYGDLREAPRDFCDDGVVRDRLCGIRVGVNEKNLGSSCIVAGKKSSNYTGRLLFSGLSGDSMVWQRDHQI